MPAQMPMERMDPSMCLAFYIRDRRDLADFCERTHRVRLFFISLLIAEPAYPTSISLLFRTGV
jgi:hypothetical protein